MRVAVLSDVHGNRLALEAVLADVRAVAPDLVLNLGDCVSGPYDPAGAADLQMAAGAVTIAGNHERGVLDAAPVGQDALARGLLAPGHLAWIAGLPPTARVDEVLACHGSPAGGDLDNLLDEIGPDGPLLAPEARIAARLEGIGDARVVVCGHTHVARSALVGGVLVLNPGSVGMPAFRVGRPIPHAMEAGTPHARYALVTRRGGTWSFELRAVAYDWDAAAAQAEAHGQPVVAYWTRTGRAPEVNPAG